MRRSTGVYGARMTGGGFGGCTISLVEAAAVETFTAERGARLSRGDRARAADLHLSPGAGVGAAA